ncbi:hypothetical protein, partial [Ferroacidibacillus organovorans]|uniref:hypothetical protein n=1 Tax=Ferroacidibacillus organovorans TaxID=1765683 RepID=UPI001F1E135C
FFFYITTHIPDRVRDNAPFSGAKLELNNHNAFRHELWSLFGKTRSRYCPESGNLRCDFCYYKDFGKVKMYSVKL